MAMNLGLQHFLAKCSDSYWRQIATGRYVSIRSLTDEQLEKSINLMVLENLTDMPVYKGLVNEHTRRINCDEFELRGAL